MALQLSFLCASSTPLCVNLAIIFPPKFLITVTVIWLAWPRLRPGESSPPAASETFLLHRLMPFSCLQRGKLDIAGRQDLVVAALRERMGILPGRAPVAFQLKVGSDMVRGIFFMKKGSRVAWWPPTYEHRLIEHHRNFKPFPNASRIGVRERLYIMGTGWRRWRRRGWREIIMIRWWTVTRPLWRIMWLCKSKFSLHPICAPSLPGRFHRFASYEQNLDSSSWQWFCRNQPLKMGQDSAGIY